jgi:hypothetical protein
MLVPKQPRKSRLIELRRRRTLLRSNPRLASHVLSDRRFFAHSDSSFLLESTQQHKSQTKDSQSTIDQDTEKQVETLKSDVEKNRSAVIDKILERVIQNDPHLHQNLKKVEA